MSNSSNIDTGSEDKPSRPAIGIDLGTSTSAIALLNGEGQPELISDAHGDTVVPSVVQLCDDGSFVVGTPAKSSAATRHEFTALEVKRLMGTMEKVTLGEQQFTPEGIAAAILRHLRAAAQAHLGEEIADVVISVPARFENDAREATRRAAEMAGLNVLRLINEPTAAALSYGLDRLETNQKVLVFDFGGGTLDVTVLEMIDGVLDVITSVGDDKLGGKDVDDVMIQVLRDAHKAQTNRSLPPPSKSARIAGMLKQEAEACKKRLSSEESVSVTLTGLTPKEPETDSVTLEITRQMLNDRLESLLMRAMVLVNDAMGRARLGWDQIDVVLPIGGSSRLPLFRRALEMCWGRPLEDYGSPDEAVARGAAVAAAVEMRLLDEESSLMILDVSPHRLGLATIKEVGSSQYMNDYFSELIAKDMKLPVKVRRDYETVFNGDEAIPVRIYEATTDSNSCQDHRLISELMLRNLKGSADKKEKVQVEFSYTLDGTLSVMVRYVDAPIIGVDGRFALGFAGTSGGSGSAVAPDDGPQRYDPIFGAAAAPIAVAAAEEGMVAVAVADAPVAVAAAGDGDFSLLWQESLPCREAGPLLEQADRLEMERPEAAPRLRAAADALRAAVASDDEAEVQRQVDILADLLFELA